MANGTISAQTARPPEARLLRIITLVVLTIILFVGFALLITWLMIRPKQITYSIEETTVHNFNLHNNHLNASFDFLIRSRNPNPRISVYYDSMDVSVLYHDQTIAFNTVQPFYQPRWNETRVEAKMESRNVALSSTLAKELSSDISYGKLVLDVGIEARVRFKVGVLKTRHRTLKVICSHVPVHFTSSKISKRIYCDTDY